MYKNYLKNIINFIITIQFMTGKTTTLQAESTSENLLLLYTEKQHKIQNSNQA